MPGEPQIDPETREALVEMKQLIPGWSGGSGEPIDLAAIDLAEQIMSLLLPELQQRVLLVPTPEGGILLTTKSSFAPCQVRIGAQGDMSIFEEGISEKASLTASSKALASAAMRKAGSP